MATTDGSVSAAPDPIVNFLRGDGPDGRNRHLREILGQDDAWLERVHDYVQWLFPLRMPSQAVAGSPTLSVQAAVTIRADPRAQAGLRDATARMSRFYATTSHWLTPFDHNHLRITRILTALHDLGRQPDAAAFHAALLARIAKSGAPVNPTSLAYWRRAVG